MQCFLEKDVWFAATVLLTIPSQMAHEAVMYGLEASKDYLVELICQF